MNMVSRILNPVVRLVTLKRQSTKCRSFSYSCRFLEFADRSKSLDRERKFSKSHQHDKVNYRDAARQRSSQREFLFDVLNASTSKRDAKQYLSRFDTKVSDKDRSGPAINTLHQSTNNNVSGVNLGQLYAPTAAIQNYEGFLQSEQSNIGDNAIAGQPMMHLAIVSIRDLANIDEAILDGLALTLAQLVKLDMRIVITFSHDDCKTSTMAQYGIALSKQARRLVRALERHNASGARYVDSGLDIVSDHEELPEVRVGQRDGLIRPLLQRRIPIIPELAFTNSGKAIRVNRSDVLYALTRTLSGIDDQVNGGSGELEEANNTSVDRIILIEPFGGLPSTAVEHEVSVFVNLGHEQEMIQQYLQDTNDMTKEVAQQHFQNMNDIARCLEILPPASSALIATPEDASNSSRDTESDDDGNIVAIRTRKQKNPLIYNLLTNRPIVSSSLPSARLSKHHVLEIDSERVEVVKSHKSTLVKRGMPVLIIPSLSSENRQIQQPWKPPISGKTDISLTHHPQINFPRLLSLIEDSFGRTLDVKAYLRRVESKLAGIIVAGEYQGGAILTWESHVTTNNSSNKTIESDKQENPPILVPYLDKFAVLRKSQGTSGVADIVFQTMTQSCFPSTSTITPNLHSIKTSTPTTKCKVENDSASPSGVCWRSRTSNPVNKWYFERCEGMWKLPPCFSNGVEEQRWTMFWTTPAEELILDEYKDRWEAYVGVCKSIKGTWLD